MSKPIRISLDDLRAASRLLIDHLADTEGEIVEIERDYFWSIDDRSLFDVYQDPKKLGIGQVSESWENLESLLRGEVEAPTRHMIWLSEVLRALGTSVTRTPPAGSPSTQE